VHLARIKLRDFRNYPKLETSFQPGVQLLLGDNAQGKTNLIEAVYLLATLRSFRGVGGHQMIRHGASGYFVGATVVGQGTRDIRAWWSERERKLSLDGQPVRRLADYLGVLRAVVFCSEDTLLVKGTARARRRYLDLILSQTQPGYLALLQRYAHALRSRNALLKQHAVDEQALEGFSVELVRAGGELMRQRSELLPRLAPVAAAAALGITVNREPLAIEYVPAVRDSFAAELARSRPRERVMRATLVGPHRDELKLTVDGKPVAQFGSEGQKRTVAIALKMAQAEVLTAVHGSPPVMLIDDVMGELDRHRRAGLVPLLDKVLRGRGQVFMTCTEENWPRELGGSHQKWRVESGSLRAAE